MKAELKALKRLNLEELQKKKTVLKNWVWLRQWKNWGNHKILARFYTPIALQGSLRSHSTSKQLTLEIVDDALWVWFM